MHIPAGERPREYDARFSICRNELHTVQRLFDHLCDHHANL